jgi:lysozyme family protein
MRENYPAFVDRMITRYEGNYGWDKADRGGPTKYGITCWDLAQHRHQKMDSMQRWAAIVRAMPLREAEDIYEVKYASAVHFDELDSGKDVVVFDTEVNSGNRGIKIAQRVVKVSQDGVMGPITLAGIKDYDAHRFINEYCDARMAFLRGLDNWGTFGGGWTRRVKDLRGYALGLLEPQKPKLGYSRKEKLILGAHFKAYDDEHMQHLKSFHSLEE